MNLLLRAVLVGLLVLAVAGCEKVVYRDREPDPPPPSPTPPGLAGTWSYSTTYDRDGQMVTQTMWVTFIGERFIEGFVLHDDNGMLIDDWYAQGGWEAADTTITKIWDPAPGNSVTKDFFWGDDQHDTIFVQCWTCDDPATEYWRLKRIDPAVIQPDNLFGTWSHQTEDAGVIRITIAQDRSFLYTFPEGGTEEVNRITGKGTLDLGNYFIDLTDLVSFDAATGETRIFLGYHDEADGTGRLAFAPAPNGIRVSSLWSEPPTNMRLHQAYGDTLRPYGDYEKAFTKDARE